jgi:hypothetical protein
MGHFNRGFLEHMDNRMEFVYLNRIKELEHQVEMFAQAEHVILAFPLYTDAMPGIVKNFFEALDPLRGRPENPSMGFVVQSGFQEPAHSRYLERYLVKLASRLGCPYFGTAVKGGGEGLQVMPGWMTKKTFHGFYMLGKEYSADKGFDEAVLKVLAPWEKMSKGRMAFFRLLNRTGLGNMYWDQQLKTNQAFEQRFDRPFMEEGEE